MQGPHPPPDVRHIGILLDTREHFFREVRRGLCEFALPRQPWVMRGLARGAANRRKLLAWNPAGVVVGLEDADMAREWTDLSCPVLSIAFRMEGGPLPEVGVDDEAVGRMAADEFIARGYQSLACLGSETDAYARRRMAGFQARAADLGRDCALRLGHSQDPAEDKPLGRWLLSLPPGTGVLAADDRWGVRASEVAREVGLSIPHDFALLSVGNDDICAMTHPRLSSIVLPGRQVGFEAGRLLDGLMRGKKAPRRPRLLPPEGIVTRASTDAVAVGDRHIAAALRLIQDKACGGVDVGAIARQAGLSRRSLEVKFRRVLGRSPLQEIRRVRIERVRQLLVETDLTLEQIAELTAFPNSQRMAVVFRELRGESPGACRRIFRRTAPALTNSP
jgi:LacI family transcriptional regulator